jgi:hypothetical protein
MKLSRERLKQLIKEELVQEMSGPTAASSAKTVAMTPAAATPATPLISVIFTHSKCLKRAIEQLDRYANMKKDSGNHAGLDKYFHILAFYTAAQVMKGCGVPEIEIRWLLAGTGFANEIRQKLTAGWKNDMVANKIGVNAALQGDTTDQITKTAFDHAANHGAPTWAELLDRNKDVKDGFWNDEKYRKEYGWALEKYPQFFGDDKPWVQPRYHGLLTPSQRREAYTKISLSPQLKVKGPLRLNKPS